MCLSAIAFSRLSALSTLRERHCCFRHFPHSFGKDIDTLDVNVPINIRMWLSAFSTVLGTIVVASVASPAVLAAFLPLAVWFYFVQRLYISSSRQLKRLDAAKRPPIYSHFQATVVGTSSVRAFGRQSDFSGELRDYVR